MFVHFLGNVVRRVNIDFRYKQKVSWGNSRIFLHGTNLCIVIWNNFI